jgi:hypothetical protein
MNLALVDGQKVAEGQIQQTQYGMFSMDELVDVGRNDGTRAVEDFGAPFPYNSGIYKVTIDFSKTSGADGVETDRVREENRARRVLSY